MIFPSSSNFPRNAVCHYNSGTPLSTSAKWEKSLTLDYSEKSVELSRHPGSPQVSHSMLCELEPLLFLLCIPLPSSVKQRGQASRFPETLTVSE